MKKVLLALGYRELEDYLVKQLKNEFQFVEPTVYREGIVRAVGQRNPDVVVIRETLNGTENILSIIYELRNRYSKKRIVFIGGNRDVGDELLATLVSYGVYDILFGEKVKAQEIIRLIRIPNEYKDVQHLQPKPTLDERTRKVLFESPEMVEREIVKEVIKEVYVDNGQTLPKNSTSDKSPNTDPSPKTVSEKVKPVLEKPSNETPPVSPSPKEVPKENLKETTLDKVQTPEVKPEENTLKKKSEKSPNSNEEEKANEPLREKKGFLELFGGGHANHNSNGKQRILTFMGAKGGVGNTSIAFNTALNLAKNKNRVLFMEMEDRTPSVAYWYELGADNVEQGIDKALLGLSEKKYQWVEDSIIKTVDLQKSDTPFKKNYKKFPATLDFMFYSNRYLTRNPSDQVKTNYEFTKELYLHLLFQLEYDYIVIDVPAKIWNESTINALMYSNKVFITTTQDVSTIGNAIYVLNELSKRDIHIDKKKHYIVNKFERAELTASQVADWIEVKDILTVPCLNKDFINANYEGLPISIHSKNTQLKQSFQKIEKTIY